MCVHNAPCVAYPYKLTEVVECLEIHGSLSLKVGSIGLFLISISTNVGKNQHFEDQIGLSKLVMLGLGIVEIGKFKAQT